ncbi:DEAD/DEAH box helicase family protein [Tenacibaculum piscium]|uniref:DEAD/DEAH box helicase family protein n=1 Tax=Tenacibaculum piscium TaxID=1458515 RepID=UPI001EFBE832|nr:DEAD/DEAH box helicase family protein [Tenacibaculum piscium]MCG8182754.1 DEAD/DEAH box helicase family protein [Tenacibaculum piscium]MCG8204146.1 DEAD/DEAH box helicase family protein [Tenacibaculum piscium]
MSNFSFLKKEFRQMYNEAVVAERYTFTAPKYAALQCRITLELGINWLYDNDTDMKRPYDVNLSALLFDKSFRETVNRMMFRELDLVRKIGNDAAHGRKVSKEQALVCLRSIFRFSTYLSKYYSKLNPEILDFNECLIPELEGGAKDKTTKQLQLRAEQAEGKLKELKESKEKKEELQKENAVLKLQVQQQQEELLARKIFRKAEINEAEAIPILTSESETRKLFIDVLLKEAGFNSLKKGLDIEFSVTGMPKVTNPSGVGYVDYVLWGDNGLPLAVIEAKSTLHDAAKGKHQAFLYANCLEKMTGQRPIIFYSNGFETFIWDDTFYPSREVSGFYTKSELEFLIEKRKSREDIRNFTVNTNIAGRPYQLEALKRIGDSLVTTHQGYLKGKNREALLVMATGSGKTRTAAAAVDMFVKCNWAKRVLFLADRNALVTQAKNAFKEHLPHLSAIDLTKEKEDTGTRLVFSTYPTIMNKIDSLKKQDTRFYGVGHFDIIIIDEAHRSIYQKYGAIFDYFDAILIGLTATPKKDIDHNTYSLFGIEDDNPTMAYELTQAVNDKFLVPPKAMDVPIKFLHEGIKYKDLSAKDKIKFEEKFGDFSLADNDDDNPQIEKGLLNKFLFNTKTVDTVLDYVMTNGIKVNAGDMLGKTIIFAKNHRHAIFIEERFNKNYPEYSGGFLKVIDNYESKAQDLLEKFCDDKQHQMPQIAVSVDMMDTGVDAPQVVNLVFFKQVRSYSKFWQMIGRGTRLRPNLFGPAKDKDKFVIFDFCSNFDYFDEFPDGVSPSATKTISQNIFETKLHIIDAIRNSTVSSEKNDALAEVYTNELHNDINTLNEDRFEVRKHLRLVIEFKKRERWNNLTVGDIADICASLSNLSANKNENDELAKRFDLLSLRLQLAILNNAKSQENYIARIHDIGIKLYKKRNIPVVANKLQLINQIKELQFWTNIDIQQVEYIRLELRELIKFIDKESIVPIYTDLEDELYDTKISERDILPTYTRLQSYKDRVEAFIRKNKSHLVIDKLHKNIPITDKELSLLESLLFDEENSTKQDYQKEYGELPLGKFIRSIIGLDIEVVNTLFASYIQNENLQPAQISFINKLINYLNINGTLDKSLLVKPPFTETHDNGIIGVFSNEQDIRKIIAVVDLINDSVIVNNSVIA